LRRRPFQPLIGGNTLFPCPENEGGSTNTAEDRPKQELGAVRTGCGHQGDWWGNWL